MVLTVGLFWSLVFFIDILLGNILQDREVEFLQTLHKLQVQQYLSIPALEVEIDKIKACVAVVSLCDHCRTFCTKHPGWL